MLHQTFLFLGQLWQLFEVSQILEFLRYCIYWALDWLAGSSKQKESKQNAIAEVLDAQILTNCQKWKYLFGYNAVFLSLVLLQITLSVLWNFAIIRVLPFLNNSKDLDPSYMMDLDFWNCFGRKITLFYNRRNMVTLILLNLLKHEFHWNQCLACLHNVTKQD